MNTYSRYVARHIPLALREEDAVMYRVEQRPARIVVLENDPESRSVIVDHILALELEPFVVADGPAILASTSLCCPAMALIACDGPPIPKQGEAELCSLIRNRRANVPFFPIIVLAPETDAFFWHYCIGDHGIDGVLHKPLRLRRLQAMLELWLDLPSAVEPAPSLPSGPDPGNWDHACLAENIQGFEQALVANDHPAMSHLAYRLGRVMSLLGVAKAIRLADRLEQAARGNKPLTPEAMRSSFARFKKMAAPYLK